MRRFHVAGRERLREGVEQPNDLGQSFELRQRAALLTEREREVVKLVVAGMLNKEIADHLGLALVTVKVHRGNAMHKLGARTGAELARMARTAGIVSGSGDSLTPGSNQQNSLHSGEASDVGI